MENVSAFSITSKLSLTFVRGALGKLTVPSALETLDDCYSHLFYFSNLHTYNINNKPSSEDTLILFQDLFHVIQNL